jgi:hypothetical protein
MSCEINFAAPRNKLDLAEVRERIYFLCGCACGFDDWNASGGSI